MEILYISSVPSYKEFYRMKKDIKKGINVTTYGMNEAGFKFHSLIMEGLNENTNVNLCSLVGRSVSFRTHKGWYWKTRKEKDERNISYKHLGFLNIPIIKQLFLGLSFFFNSMSWLLMHKNEHDKYLIMDASYITAIPFVMLAAKIMKCKTSAVFCDIYGYMADVKDARGKTSLLYKILAKFTGRTYRKLDTMVLLTEQMNNVINPLSKPYVIIEGLVDIKMKDSGNEIENKTPNKVVMYAGALREQYGLKNLIIGFMQYKDENARLWIFGAGDYANEIKNVSKIDKRIIFFGQAELDQVIQKELKADLLINPRPADLEFTQYSFPSKNMEYMVSGTPLLTTKLPGIPLEYYNYVYTIEGSRPEDISTALHYCFSKTKEELHEKGRDSKQFVLNKKNNIVQAKKILDMVRG